jgi:2-polyprenyl-3-methyl-5-hydroxy-6-metoxy-1,4-benzoquinol methylase
MTGLGGVLNVNRYGGRYGTCVPPRGLEGPLFVHNNEWIDFCELERRAALEIAKLARTAGSPPRQAPLWGAALSPDTGTAAPEENEMAAEAAPRRSIWRIFSHLVWGISHLPSVLRRAISGVFSAEYARSEVATLTQFADAIQLRVAASEQAIGALTGRIANVSANAAARQSELDNRTRETLTTASTLAARFEDLAAQFSRLTEQLAMVRREVTFQQRQLTRFAVPTADQPPESAPAVLTHRFDALYAALEDVCRGNREAMIERLTPYVERLIVAGAGLPDKPVIDIGCGQGEWLELLRREGLSAYGIDINRVMVERCTARGLDARPADVMAHLRGLEDVSRGAVTAFHVVEHLPFATLIDLLDESLRILIPGGTLILETPNPETLRVGATTLYQRPNRNNPLMPETLKCIVEHRGFNDIEIIRLHPFADGLLRGTSEDARLLNHVLSGPRDFGIIARRL